MDHGVYAWGDRTLFLIQARLLSLFFFMPTEYNRDGILEKER
jgi:hypothetical protein